MTVKSIARTLLCCLAIAGCRDARLPLVPARIDIDDPAACEGCHGEITREWRESMHARAARGDAIFAQILAVRSKKEGADLVTKCAPCHEPRPGKAGAELAGVSCAACHAVASVGTDGHGAGRLVAAPPHTLFGSHDIKPSISPAHETGSARPHLTDGATLCLACHDSLANAQKVSLCATGVEWRSSVTEGSPPSCTQCHMPRVPGAPTVDSTRVDHAEHRFRGPARLRHFKDDRTAGEAVRLEAKRTDDEVTLVITNVTHHAFPTGFPGRVAQLTIRGLDASGLAVFTSTMALQKVYLDPAGQPTMAPYAVSLSKDTRFQAGEARTIVMPLVPGTERVELEVSTQLLATPLAKMIGLMGSPLLAPVVVGRATATR